MIETLNDRQFIKLVQQKTKKQVRDKAIEWQADFGNHKAYKSVCDCK